MKCTAVCSQPVSNAKHCPGLSISRDPQSCVNSHNLSKSHAYTFHVGEDVHIRIMRIERIGMYAQQRICTYACLYAVQNTNNSACRYSV